MTVTKTPITIRTISDLAGSGMTLGLYCLECDRWGEVIPREWLDEGKPDLNYVEQKFKCSQCGGDDDDACADLLCGSLVRDQNRDELYGKGD
jgi:hypothetical protein